MPGHQNQNWEYDHGRFEIRTCSVLDAKQSLSPDLRAKWKGIEQLVRIQAQRHIGDQITEQIRYYISSDRCATPAKFNELTREHWGIENHLHWHLDVTFQEDKCRARTGHAAENLNIMRKVALHRLANCRAAQDTKLSLKKRRFKASLNGSFLEQILDL